MKLIKRQQQQQQKQQQQQQHEEQSKQHAKPQEAAEENSHSVDESGTEQAVVPPVRSLRRRLWKAFEEEDVAAAFRAYTATMTDLQQWIDQERQEESQRRQQLQEKRDAQRPVALKKIGSMMKNTKRSSLRRSGQSSRKLSNSSSCLNHHRDTNTSLLNGNHTKNNHVEQSTTATTTAATTTTTNNATKYQAEIQFPLLQLEINPSEPFQADDYKNPQDTYHETIATKPPARNRRSFIPCKKKRRQKNPRVATSFFKTFKSSRWAGRGEVDFSLDDQSSDDESSDADQMVDERMTTPFHEAARCGNGPLIQIMLDHDSIGPNFKNGQLRTALHMVAGGVTAPETIHYRCNGHSHDALPGIGAPQPISPPNQQSQNDSYPNSSGGAVVAKKAAKVMNRLFQSHFSQQKLQLHHPHSSEDDHHQGQVTGGPEGPLFPSTNQPTNADKLKADRLDALLAILSYVHPDDGTINAGEGPSINAVDALGRTPLHYAAELGREDVCMTLLSSFGIILTVVDDSARTPCELAASQNHHKLAAQLEARALLYTDPYGMDEELMASVLPDDYYLEQKRRASLVPPFAWFETLLLPDTDRQQRLTVTFQEMENTAKKLQEEQDMQNFMYSQDTTTTTTNDKQQTQHNKHSHHNQQEKTKPTPNHGEQNHHFHVHAAAPSSDDASLQDNNMDHETNINEKDNSCEITENGCFSNQQITNMNGDLTQELTPLGLTPSKEAKVEGSDATETNITEDVQGGFSPLEIFQSLTESHIEQFLSFHGWMVEKALETFTEDPAKAIKDAGIEFHPSNNETAVKNDDAEALKICSICFEEFDESSGGWRNLKHCEHSFCVECLGDYLSECAQSRSSGLTITCPHHECNQFMSPDEISSLAPSKHIYQLLRRTATEKFVSAAKDLRFCPHPSCKGVVKLHVPEFVKHAKVDVDLLGLVGAVCTAVHSNDNDSDVDADVDANAHAEADDDADAASHNQQENKEKVHENNNNSSTSTPLTYEGVLDPQYMNSRTPHSPKKAHRFCFVCGESSYHWPVTCEQLAKWKEKMREEVEQITSSQEGAAVGPGDAKYDDIAQQLWMKANTRPCPKCKAPIEKNEGCNHMTCTNPHCKHEFCWICREDWKLHNTSTGGFFRCNRWQDEENHEFYDSASKPDNTSESAEVSNNSDNGAINDEETMNDPEVMLRTYGTAMHEARIAMKKSKEMKRFLHHYTRWNAHCESAALEKKMSETVCSRLAPVVEAAIEFTNEQDFNFGGKGLSFVHAAFTELLECRSILQHSYAFSFYRYESLSTKQYRRQYRRVGEKREFEYMQSELEILTEQISDIVARSHLRATQTQIIYLTFEVAERRNDFTNFMLSVLNEARKDEKREATNSSVSERYYSSRLPRHRSQRLSGAILPTAVNELGTGLMDHVVGRHNHHGGGAAAAAAAAAELLLSHQQRSQDSDSNEAIVEALRASLDAGVELNHSHQRSSREQDRSEAIVDALRASLGEFMGSHNDVISGQNNDGNHDSANADLDSDDDSDDAPLSDWACTRCTYMNSGGQLCAMCGIFRN